jgi:GT2 family glycosyltransferase
MASIHTKAEAVSASVMDLLCEPFESPAMAREQNTFSTSEAWAVADFGKRTVAAGWWRFECEGDQDISGVELRLISAEDALLVFSPARAANMIAMIPNRRTFSVRLMVSPWPGLSTMSKLRLRRLSRREEAGLAKAMISRVLKADRPIAKLAHAASRAIGGRTLRVQTPISVPVPPPPVPGTGQNTAFETHRHGGITAVIRASDTLHPRAFDVVSAKFASDPRLQSIYADVEEAGVIRPLPQWDPDLQLDRIAPACPVFFRGEAEAIDPWPRVASLATTEGTVTRIALPLSRRANAMSQHLSPPPRPQLECLPSVSVVVPTRSRLDLLKRCLLGLAHRTDYPALDVLVVDNGAESKALSEAIAPVQSVLAVRTIAVPGPFNFSRLINRGVAEGRGEVVLLLNDDVEAIEPGWLHRMTASAMLSGVGCVGARLVYPDRTIQHAGVMLGLAGPCGHLWKGLDEAQAEAVPQIVLPSGRMAVTGACLAVRRKIFDEVGGLDEDAFGIAFNDIDLCLRVRQHGLRTLYRGDAVLIHHESQSRGPDDAKRVRRRRLARESGLFLERWGALLQEDPFASPAYDLTRESGAVHPALKFDS